MIFVVSTAPLRGNKRQPLMNNRLAESKGRWADRSVLREKFRLQQIWTVRKSDEYRRFNINYVPAKPIYTECVSLRLLRKAIVTQSVHAVNWNCSTKTLSHLSTLVLFLEGFFANTVNSHWSINFIYSLFSIVSFSLFVFCFFAEKSLPFVYRFHTNGRLSECRNLARKY